MAGKPKACQPMEWPCQWRRVHCRIPYGYSDSASLEFSCSGWKVNPITTRSGFLCSYDRENFKAVQHWSWWFSQGLSNGGGDGIMLSCTLSDVSQPLERAGAFTYPWKQATAASMPWSLSGLADKIVPYYGGYAKRIQQPLPPVPDWIAEFANGMAALK